MSAELSEDRLKSHYKYRNPGLVVDGHCERLGSRVTHLRVFLSILVIVCLLMSPALIANEVELEKPVVFAVSYPLAHFAQRLGGSRFKVLFPDGSPTGHGWKPSLEEVIAMQSSTLILIGDVNRERWLDRVTLPGSVVVDTTSEVADQLIRNEGESTHTHGPDGEHSHTASANNPWLDLTLALAQAEAVATAMGRIDPDAGVEIEAHLKDIEIELLALDKELLDLSKDAGGTRLFTVGQDYEYLARRYGLRLETVDLDMTNPAELERLLRESPARWLIWPQSPPAETVAWLRGLDVESVVLDPLGARPASGDFMSVMRRNADTLKRVLSEP